MSKGRAVALSVAALAVAAAVLVIALTRGGGESGRPAPPPGSLGEHPSRPGERPARPRTAEHPRAAVRKGSGPRPDEPADGTGPLVGIADQKPQTFADPRFRALGVKRVRLNTPWNAVFTEPARLGAWLGAAHAAHLEPLVAFEHARGDACPARPCSLPSPSAYARAVREFHARYPWVTLIQPWNEANSGTQPTGTHPEAAAAYYEVVRRTCPSCVVPAADLLDSANVERWLRRFDAALPGRRPTLWGLHDYSDVNRFHDSGTRRVLDLVPGEVWLTETGGIVSFTAASGRVALPPDPQRAARATRFMFRLAARFPRIKRIYVYQWKIDFPGNRFDAGLVDSDGRPRPALAVLAAHEALIR